MRLHKGTDAWGRGSYSIPEYAVVGCSYCGEYSDSPAKGVVVAHELHEFAKVLKRHGIKSREKQTTSGNLFMVKRWVVVKKDDFPRAKKLALAHLKRVKDSTLLIHDADLEGVA